MDIRYSYRRLMIKVWDETVINYTFYSHHLSKTRSIVDDVNFVNEYM